VPQPSEPELSSLLLIQDNRVPASSPAPLVDGACPQADVASGVQDSITGHAAARKPSGSYEDAAARSTFQFVATISSALFNASHAARCVACHGVRSHAEPVALVGECSIPLM
jgi:hypothetical protein